MIDMQKVIKGLECCTTGEVCLSDCPYFKEMAMADGRCITALQVDALSMLKEQEAVEPILEQDSMVCGVCGHEVIWQKMLGEGIWADEKLDYCPHCGRKVKWE